MNKKTKNILIKLSGISLILVGILGMVNAFIIDSPQEIIWICYIAVILIGISAITRKPKLLTAQLNIMLIPLIFWSIDFLYHLTFGQTLFNIASYVFEPRPLLSQIVSSLHIITIPLSLFILYLVEAKEKIKDSWKISLIQILIIFFITILFTTPEVNVNCVYESCTNISLGLPTIIEWFIGIFSMIAISYIIIKNLKFLKTKQFTEKTNN